VDFFKQNLPKPLLQASHNLQIGINAFDIFARIKLFSESLFHCRNLQDL